jgi:hypothetical protein
LERDNAIAKLESELGGVKQENKDQVLTIAELENNLIGAMAEIQVMGEVKQLPLFPPEPTQPTAPEPVPEPKPEPEPEPEPENIKSPAVESEPLTVPLILLDTIEGTVPRKVIMDRILEIDPATEINGQIITDAVLGHNQRLSELETTYDFKFVGYVMRGKNREYRYKLS